MSLSDAKEFGRRNGRGHWDMPVLLPRFRRPRAGEDLFDMVKDARFREHDTQEEVILRFGFRMTVNLQMKQANII